MSGWILLAILALLIGYGIIMCNKPVKYRLGVGNYWSQIDVQLKRRHDLIPNLMETVKGYMEFEKETLIKVMEARSKAMRSSN
jgi:LemA protein